MTFVRNLWRYFQASPSIQSFCHSHPTFPDWSQNDTLGIGKGWIFRFLIWGYLDCPKRFVSCSLWGSTQMSDCCFTLNKHKNMIWKNKGSMLWFVNPCSWSRISNSRLAPLGIENARNARLFEIICGGCERSDPLRLEPLRAGLSNRPRQSCFGNSASWITNMDSQIKAYLHYYFFRHFPLY
jgi:hypothetical protein